MTTQIRKKRTAGRRAATRDAIFHAALRVISESGSRGVSIGRIAREAGYTQGALYRYFKSKEELLDAVEEYWNGYMKEWYEIFEEPVPPGFSFQQAVEWLSHLLVRYLEKQAPDANQVFGARPWNVASVFDEENRIVHAYAAWVERNATAADLGDLEPADVAGLLYGALRLAHLRWWEGKARTSLRSELQRTNALVWRALPQAR